MIKFNAEGALPFLKSEPDYKAAQKALSVLLDGSGAGAGKLGWVRLPFDYDKEEMLRLKERAKHIRENAEALVVIGIGGSYLGARAVIEAMLSPRYNEIERKGPKVYFIGNGINGDDLAQVLSLVDGKSFYVNVISKSGTTLEPALAFRIFREKLEERYGKDEARKRIICTTDRQSGALKSLAASEGYECFVVPENVGGRYSVLTPVGLLPIAAAGIDTDSLIAGAASQAEICASDDVASNPALRYAAVRQALYRQLGKKIEILSCPSESVRFVAEWWKQLYGEPEGKQHMGIFPASCVFTADLHSMGQYIQDGERILAETFLSFEGEGTRVEIPFSKENADGLNYVAGKDYRQVYAAAQEGVMRAHISGGVPCSLISVPAMNEEGLGALIYFFEAACGISGYMQGVNPFDQPGVEEYKKNMFALLGKK